MDFGISGFASLQLDRPRRFSLLHPQKGPVTKTLTAEIPLLLLKSKTHHGLEQRLAIHRLISVNVLRAMLALLFFQDEPTWSKRRL